MRGFGLPVRPPAPRRCFSRRRLPQDSSAVQSSLPGRPVRRLAGVSTRPAAVAGFHCLELGRPEQRNSSAYRWRRRGSAPDIFISAGQILVCRDLRISQAGAHLLRGGENGISVIDPLVRPAYLAESPARDQGNDHEHAKAEGGPGTRTPLRVVLPISMARGRFQHAEPPVPLPLIHEGGRIIHDLRSRQKRKMVAIRLESL